MTEIYMYGESPFPSDEKLDSLCREIHAANVEAGWWSDLQTGESTLETRNRPEMLMLSVSELSEASDGWMTNEPDDKLGHLPMFDVELSDIAIRLFDTMGAYESILGRPTIGWRVARERAERTGSMMRNETTNGALMLIVNELSKAMEHFRKGRIEQYVQAMADAQMCVFKLAEQRGILLLDIIDQKRAFNRNRADHKIENRRAEGGKQF